MNSNLVNFFIGDNSKIAYVIFPLLILHLTNVFLDEYLVKKNVYKNKSSVIDKLKTTSIISIFIFLILAVLLLFVQLGIISKIFLLLNTLYLMYIIIICPLFNIKLGYNFKNDSTIISSFLITEVIYFINKSKYTTLTNLFTNENIFQISVIFSIFLISFLILYLIILNIYNIFKNLNSLYLLNLNKTIVENILKIDKKYGIDNLDKLFKRNNKNLFKYSIYFFLQSIIFILMNFIIRTFLFIVSEILNIIDTTFSVESNNVFYTLSKISLLISLFFVYITILFSKTFSEPIISIYELTISSITIPIILEMLLSRKEA